MLSVADILGTGTPLFGNRGVHVERSVIIRTMRNGKISDHHHLRLSQSQTSSQSSTDSVPSIAASDSSKCDVDGISGADIPSNLESSPRSKTQSALSADDCEKFFVAFHQKQQHQSGEQSTQFGKYIYKWTALCSINHKWLKLFIVV